MIQKKFCLIGIVLAALMLVSVCGCLTPQPQSVPLAPENVSIKPTTITTHVTAKASITPSVTPSSTPSVAPSATPSPQQVTGSFGQSEYSVNVGSAVTVTATVSNWQLNPTVYVKIPDAHWSNEPMQSDGNGGYSATVEGIGTGSLTLIDNGAIINHATLITESTPSPTPTATPTPSGTQTPEALYIAEGYVIHTYNPGSPYCTPFRASNGTMMDACKA